MKSNSRPGCPKIAYVGVYADPNASGGNNLLWTQAHEISQLLYDVEIITWPRPHVWTGRYPSHDNTLFGDVPVLSYKRTGLTYHVISPPPEWGEVVAIQQNWNLSINWAKQLLRQINPSIVHQHHWQRTWFFMEAALQLGIPTIYTAYDWGLPCRRQFLVRGDGSPCLVQPSVKECVICCSLQGNGKLSKGESASEALPMSDQVEKLIERWQSIAPRLAALIVTSPFASQFYQSTGIDKSLIHEMPWFYSQPDILIPNAVSIEKPVRLGFLGRLVPEKGLHVLLEALQRLDSIPQLILEIAGAINNDYARSLRENFGTYAGKHEVIWSEWIPNRTLGHFFRRVHALVVPSLWYDNAPTVLVEALAHHCPVICTDLPSMTHLIHHNRNGLVFPINDSQELAFQISRFVTDQDLALGLCANAMYEVNSRKYADALSKIYECMI